MKRLIWWRLAALSAFGFAITLVSNTLDPAVFGHKVLQLAPDQPNTLLGISTFVASLLAFIMGPIVGALSDQAQKSRGSRMLHFLLGVSNITRSIVPHCGSEKHSLFCAGGAAFSASAIT